MPTLIHGFDAVPTPPLSDEAAVYLHDALLNYLEVFERHYWDQIRRYYDHRSQHKTPQPPPGTRKNPNPNDEPF